MADVVILKGDIHGLQAGIDPVALVDEHGLLVGKGGQLVVIGAGGQHGLITEIKQQLHIIGIFGEAGFVHFASIVLVNNAGIGKLQATAQVNGEVMMAGDPPGAAGHAGGHGYDAVDAQFSFHAVQLFKGSFQGRIGSKGGRIDIRLLEQFYIVAQAKTFDGHGEAHNFSFGIQISQCGVGVPFFLGQICNKVFPQAIVTITFNNKDVRQLIGSVFGCQVA